VAVSFGTAGADFVEERRFVQGSPDEDPVRESLNYRVVGDLFVQDATGAPLTGNFDVLVDGTFFEEQHFFNTGGEPLLGTSLIDANKLRTSGSIRLANEIVDGEQTSIRVTTTQYESGVLTHDIFEEKSEPEFVRKEWVFDDFKLEVGRNTSTDELSQKISGRVRINRPETAEPGCVSGLLQFVTPIRVAETGQDSQQFTSGLMIINDASIRFTADNPGVTIKSPGSDPVQFSDGSSLLGFGNCTY
jgi:hypothetical protein